MSETRCSVCRGALSKEISRDERVLFLRYDDMRENASKWCLHIRDTKCSYGWLYVSKGVLCVARKKWVMAGDNFVTGTLSRWIIEESIDDQLAIGFTLDTTFPCLLFEKMKAWAFGPNRLRCLTLGLWRRKTQESRFRFIAFSVWRISIDIMLRL